MYLQQTLFSSIVSYMYRVYTVKLFLFRFPVDASHEIIVCCSYLLSNFTSHCIICCVRPRRSLDCPSTFHCLSLAILSSLSCARVSLLPRPRVGACSSLSALALRSALDNWRCDKGQYYSGPLDRSVWFAVSYMGTSSSMIQ